MKQHFTMKDKKYIEKFDIEGEKFAGKIHSSDFGAETRRSKNIIDLVTSEVIFPLEGVESFVVNRFFSVEPGTNFVLSFDERHVRGKGLNIWTNSQINTFRVARKGVYAIFGTHFVNCPIDLQIMETNLKLFVDSEIYLLDSEPMVSQTTGGSASYHHFSSLTGSVLLWLAPSMELQVVFRFESSRIPLANLETSHSARISFVFLGDGLE